MVKDKKEYIKRTFEVDKDIYREFRASLLAAGITVKHAINKILKGYIDEKRRK